jgi:hypothetical protein
MGPIKPDQPGRHPPAKPTQPTRTYQRIVNGQIIRVLIFYGRTMVLPNTRPARSVPTLIPNHQINSIKGSNTSLSNSHACFMGLTLSHLVKLFLVSISSLLMIFVLQQMSVEEQGIDDFVLVLVKVIIF